MPFISDVSANYHSDKPSECYARCYTCMVHVGTYIALRPHHGFRVMDPQFAIYWSYTVLRFLFLIPVSFIRIADGKILYKLTNISVFSLLGVSATISRDVTVKSTRFLHAGQGNMTVAFSVFSHIFL